MPHLTCRHLAHHPPHLQHWAFCPACICLLYTFTAPATHPTPACHACLHTAATTTARVPACPMRARSDCLPLAFLLPTPPASPTGCHTITVPLPPPPYPPSPLYLPSLLNMCAAGPTTPFLPYLPPPAPSMVPYRLPAAKPPPPHISLTEFCTVLSCIPHRWTVSLGILPVNRDIFWDGVAS